MQAIRLAKVQLLLTLTLAAGSTGRAATYLVSTTGNDAGDGLSEKTAWRTIAHAAKMAQAGDLVLVAPGDYGAEQVVVANSGEPERPILFKGHGGRLRLVSDSGTDGSKDGGKTAFLVDGKSYVRIEGFEILGYGGARVVVTKSSHIQVRDLRCPGRGGDIVFSNGVSHSWMDNCYIEDSYRNSLFIYGDPYYKLKPSTFNVISNCAVVRGGHSSIDVHTGCPDSYVVGCLMREMGQERDGRRAGCGLYLHNHHIDRLRAIGNAVSDVYWGLELAGAADSLIADNLILNFAKADLDFVSLPGEGFPDEACVRNTIRENILFDASVPSRDATAVLRLRGAKSIALVRNYIDGSPDKTDYQCFRTRGVEASDNRILDPAKGRESLDMQGGSFSVAFSPGLWPRGTRFRLTGEGKVFEATLGSEEALFGNLSSGRYTVEAVAPEGELVPPQHLRVAAMPNVEGGAVAVWADRVSNETGFAIERRLADQKQFSDVATVAANATRYIDKEVGRQKAIYRVRALRGLERSQPSNEDEVVRYGYWFTDRTGLKVDAGAAFAQVEQGDLKTLIVEKAQRVERAGDAVEGASSSALLEGGGAAQANGIVGQPKLEEAEPTVWLIADKPVTVTLRWRSQSIRGYVEAEGDYSVELFTGRAEMMAALFNGQPVKVTFDEKTQRVRLHLAGNGHLQVTEK